MTRLVSVRYLVPVYATVDLDAEKTDFDGWYPDDAVTRIFIADESIFMTNQQDAAIAYLGDPLTDALEADEEDQVDPASLSPEDHDKAIEIANNTVWPSWTNS